MFRGAWTVEQIAENPVAQDFWRRVIADFTGGSYTVTGGDDITLSFNS